MSLPELKAELLRAEYPFLRPDHDPDIERYFDLRAAGRPGDALVLYDSRLKTRYPDDSARAATLRAYRLKEPAYPAYMAVAYAALGDRVLERTKRLIRYVAVYASSYDRGDAYATIRAAESILRMLPSDRFEAVSGIERLHRFAERLEYQAAALETAENLIRAYLNEQLDIVETERARKKAEREQAFTERRRRLSDRDKTETEISIEAARERRDARKREEAEKGKRRPRASISPIAAMDLSAIRFSAADLARIQIPPMLVKIEDRTLAFCFKYWNLIEDRAFERVLFLYSRKHGVKHYDVYSAVRDGRRRGKRDEEILSSVSSILTTGYYYSIRGDVYLQRNWAKLKAKIDPGPGPRSTVAARPRRRPVEARAARIPAENPTAPIASPSASDVRDTPPPALRTTRAPRASLPAQTARIRRSRNLDDAPASEEASGRQLIAHVPLGSVSDRLRKLSGRSYDVFQDRFLAKARAAIRTVLSETRNGRKALFPSIPQEAEELVFAFLRDHYANPYMNWEGSAERKNLSALGFELESVDPVIEDCYRRL